MKNCSQVLLYTVYNFSNIPHKPVKVSWKMKIYFGFAESDIEPVDFRTSLAGYFNERPRTGSLDPLRVRAVCMRDRTGRLFALIQFDLVTVTDALAAGVFDSPELPEGIDRSNLLLTATHTHTAPEIRDGKPGVNSRYRDFVAAIAVRTLVNAVNSLRPGSLWRADGTASHLGFNRRYLMRDGSVKTNPGKGNPEVVAPEGKNDETIPVLLFRDAAGVPAGIIANIVNHSDTIGGTRSSADWPGRFIRKLRGHFGENFFAAALIGCAGNINHIDLDNPDPQCSEVEAERIGIAYAEAVMRILEHAIELPEAEFEIFNPVLEMPPREYSEAELREARETVEKYRDLPAAESTGRELTAVELAAGDPVVLRFFAENLLRAAAAARPSRFPLIGIRFGRSGIIALPCEPFVEIGLELKKIFPGALVVSHTNSCGGEYFTGGYIPIASAYDRGGYEDRPRSSPYSKRTGAALVEMWKKMLC